MNPSRLSVTEHRNPASEKLDQLSIPELIALFDDEELKVVEAVRLVGDALATVTEAVVASFRQGGRLIYIGAGTSGRLGVLDASECPPTFGTPHELVQGIIAGGDSALRRSIEGAEDHGEEGAAAIRNCNILPHDVVIGIATSGCTPYPLGALEQAHQLGATTALLSCTPPAADLARYVDHFLTPIVGPEIVTGSTRLKAGTATKLILNRITTIAMIRTGKVYGNLMVDVQAWCAKLVDRAERIISEVTGVDHATAAEYLKRAHGDAKVAIVMCHHRVSKDRAASLLEHHQGFLGKVLSLGKETVSAEDTSEA